MNASTHSDELHAPSRTRPPQAGGSDAQRQRSILRNVSRGVRFLDLAFWFLYGLILLQIALEAMGARDASGFKQFLDAVTGPFLAPFRGLLDDPTVQDHQIMLSYICAMVVYALLQTGIKRLIATITEATTGRRLPAAQSE